MWRISILLIASFVGVTIGQTLSPSQTPTHVPTPKTPTPAPSISSNPTNTPFPTAQPTPLPTSQPTRVPSPSPTFVPSINVECSSARCSELSWNNAVSFGSSLVCGESDKPPLTGCSGEVSWEAARSLCQAAGARLCTVAELQDDEARATGCNYDTSLVWAQERCDNENGHWAAWGSTLMGDRSYCLNGTSLSGSQAVTRCCADVEACLDPTHLPTSNPIPLPTPLPTPEPSFYPTALPTKQPSPVPTAVNFTDCNGNEVSSEWLGDGFCDAGYFDFDGVAINLNCSARDFDGGDCLSSSQQSTFPLSVVLSRDCTSCYWNASIDNSSRVRVCPSAPKSWIGDGVCDDGEYGYGSYGSIDFDCATYNHDGYDCCTKDAQYETVFTGPPPACLKSSASPASCGSLYGNPPPCWKTDKLGLTCDWLTPILGGCRESLVDSKRPHVDVRACADSCIFSNCTQDYAVELVQTYYEMCLDVPSALPTLSPTSSPTVSYERKIQCDVNKQQTCATRSRGDSCTDWNMECFYVQCPAGVEENGRDATGKCFRESAHLSDWRTFTV